MAEPQKSTLYELTRMRVLLFFREPEALFWVLAFPIIMSLVLAFAFAEKGIAPSKVAVVGKADSKTELTDRKDLTLEFGDSLETALYRLHRGKVDLVWEIGKPGTLHFDANREEAVAARLRMREVIMLEPVLGSMAEGDRGQLSVRDEQVSGRGSRYIDFLFPGLLGLTIMGTSVWGIAFFLTEQRQKKLLRRLLVTPMRRVTYLLSFFTSRLVFLGIEIVVLLIFALLILDVPQDGSWLAFGVLSLIGALSFAGLGLLVASRASKIETVSNLVNLVMMPMWLASGIFFSYERFPEFAQPFCKALPLSALNDGLRAIMLDGSGLLEIIPECAILVAWGLITFVLALRIFRWQ